MPKGKITLLVLIGAHPRQVSMMVDFLVVKAPFAYNTIINQLYLRMAQAVISSYHLIVKFPTKYRVREVGGVQVAARECYFNSTKD